MSKPIFDLTSANGRKLPPQSGKNEFKCELIMKVSTRAYHHVLERNVSLLITEVADMKKNTLFSILAGSNKVHLLIKQASALQLITLKS